MRLLIIEDEPDMLLTLTQAMREQGYAVDGASDGPEGLHKATEWEYDAVIMDGMLPEMDGFEVLRRIRLIKKVPVLMLTARANVKDRIHGLDAGADDYLTKPVDLDELAARLRAIIRRTLGEATSIIQIQNIAIDTSSRRASKGGEPVVLTGGEYPLLEYLALRRGKIVTRRDLYDHLYDENDTPLSNIVDVQVSNLRKKFGKDFIVTHRGQGYCIDA